jgi:hypothetical protein
MIAAKVEGVTCYYKNAGLKNLQIECEIRGFYRK